MNLQLQSKDIVAAALIVAVSTLIALGYDGTLIKILLGIAIAYGIVQLPRPPV